MELTDRIRRYIPKGDGYNDDFAHDLTEAVEKIDSLTAENRALREQSDKDDASILQIIDERDYAQDMADKLAARIADSEGLYIGEHSSGNCPWTNALEGVSRDQD